MTFKEACRAMAEGEHVYRPGWPAGTYIAADSSAFVLYEGGRACCLWTASLDDLAARDWACEVYVTLV